MSFPDALISARKSRIVVVQSTRKGVGGVDLTVEEEKPMRQRDAAEQLGVSKGTYIQWELGKAIPKPRHFQRIRAYLDIPLDELVGMFS